MVAAVANIGPDSSGSLICYAPLRDLESARSIETDEIVAHIALGPKGRVLVATFRNGFLKAYDLDDGRVLNTFEYNQAAARQKPVVSPAGDVVLCVPKRRAAQIRRLRDDAEMTPLIHCESTVRFGVFDSAGDRIAIVADGGVRSGVERAYGPARRSAFATLGGRRLRGVREGRSDSADRLQRQRGAAVELRIRFLGVSGAAPSVLGRRRAIHRGPRLHPHRDPGRKRVDLGCEHGVAPCRAPGNRPCGHERRVSDPRKPIAHGRALRANPVAACGRAESHRAGAGVVFLFLWKPSSGSGWSPSGALDYLSLEEQRAVRSSVWERPAGGYYAAWAKDYLRDVDSFR